MILHFGQFHFHNRHMCDKIAQIASSTTLLVEWIY